MLKSKLRKRNFFIAFLKRANRDYYENLDLGKVNDSKKIWNKAKPVSGNKVTTRNNNN